MAHRLGKETSLSILSRPSTKFSPHAPDSPIEFSTVILLNMLKRMLRSEPILTAQPPTLDPNQKLVLNVGGSSKQIPIPAHFDGWTHLLLDVDPAGSPDIVCDARELGKMQAGQFDAVYCSHNLEHYYKHHGQAVLRGFLHVLKPDGFADIRVPDLKSVMKKVVESGMDIEDALYISEAGPISVRDVIYGWGKQIESSGVDFFAHKTGFTAQSLAATLFDTGFGQVLVDEAPEFFELRALAFKGEPSPGQRTMLGLPSASLSVGGDLYGTTIYGNT